MMNVLLGIAVVLLIIWLVAKLALAVSGALLHLLWIIAIALVVIWLIGKIRGKG